MEVGDGEFDLSDEMNQLGTELGYIGYLYNRQDQVAPAWPCGQHREKQTRVK